MITNYNQIDLAGSPLYYRLPKFITGTETKYVKMTLTIWQGAYDRTTITKDYTKDIYLEYIDYRDTDVIYDIAPYIVSFLDRDFYFYGDSLGISLDELCYWKATSNQYGGSPIAIIPGTTFNSGTRAATLGYNWRYEKDRKFTPVNGANGFDSVISNLYWSQGIKYFKSQVNLNVATSQAMVTRTEVIGGMSTYLMCTEEPYLIVYRNRLGLWSQFTPFGKVLVTSEIDDTSYIRTYRNGIDAYQPYKHQKIRQNVIVNDTFTINTGYLKPEMIDVIEELVYSDCVWLVQFQENAGDAFKLTVDSTVITVDNTDITIDMTNSNEYYTVYNQIPVVINQKDFTRKNNYNDKGHINYTIKLEASSAKKRI